MKVLLVRRAERFSPNMRDRDAAILQAVGRELEAMGHSIQVCAEEDLSQASPDQWDAVYHMARSREALARLAEWERRGVRVVNPAESLLQLSRKRLLSLAEERGVSVPRHAVGRRGDVPFPLWWKRDDQVSQKRDDVVFCRDEADWDCMLQRGISDYVVEEHLEGQLVKFYSVRGTDFFHWQIPTYDKWSGDVAPSNQGLVFDEEQLKEMADTLADAAGLVVFGGDAIVTRDHQVYIIDFNDWPSFSSCRDQAAKYIVYGK